MSFPKTKAQQEPGLGYAKCLSGRSPAALKASSLPAKSSTVEYGKLDFVLVTDGLVWMLTTTRFRNSGGSDGNWLAELRTQSQLETDGWRIIARDVQSEYGSAPPGENKSLQEWLLFERTCKAGERFSIRTEKYQSPVILRPKSGITEDAPGLRLRMVKSGTGRMQLEAKGDPGLYLLQSASDLRSWVDVNEARLTSANFETVSSVDVTVSMRFFRLQKSPPQPPQPPAAAPIIVTHPVSFSVKEGQRFGLSVVATGSGALTFQWFLNGTPIPGATASLYSATAKLDSAGSYTVTVSSGLATVTSRQGVLTVIPNSSEVAPLSLAGRTIRVNSSRIGSFLFITSPTEAKYVIFPENGVDGTKGTYTYTKSGPNQGTIVIDDYWSGGKTGSAIFTSATTGSGFLGDFGGSFIIQETVSPTAALAPTTLAERQSRLQSSTPMVSSFPTSTAIGWSCNPMARAILGPAWDSWETVLAP